MYISTSQGMRYMYKCNMYVTKYAYLHPNLADKMLYMDDVDL